MVFVGFAILIILTLTVLAISLLIAPARCTAAMRDQLRGQRYAHRGLHENAGGLPENSMKAFRAAIEKGYAIELDIRLTKDGRIVVFHDDTLQRICGKADRVASQSLAALKELRLLDTEEQIPEFGEFLNQVQGRVPLLVEFKTGLPGADRAAVDRLCEAAMVLLDGYQGPFIIESFDYLVLAWFKKYRPQVMRGQLGMGLHCYIPALGRQVAESIPLYRRKMLSWLLYNYAGRPHFISYRYQDAGLSLTLCRGLGACVAVWTVKTALDSARLLSRYDAVIFEGFSH